jgi:uncharacterized phage-like protein YoqJ
VIDGLENLDVWFSSARILAGTGHRPDKLNNEYSLQGPCSDFLRNKIKLYFELLKPKRIISGMALGFDQLFALVALEQSIPVMAAIPCDNQEKIWPSQSQKLYQSILDNPLVKTKIISPGSYTKQKMSIRNEWMVDNSDAVLAVWDGSNGGTANCVKYAEKVKKLIYKINPEMRVKE